MKSFHYNKGPYASSKIIQVPNSWKLTDLYKIKYDGVHDEMNGWVTELQKKQVCERMFSTRSSTSLQSTLEIAHHKKISPKKVKKRTDPLPQTKVFYYLTFKRKVVNHLRTKKTTPLTKIM